MLVCLDHRRGVARKERAQQPNKARDGAFLGPDRRCEEKGKKGPIVGRYASVQPKHLREDLEDVGYIFCGTQGLLPTLNIEQLRTIDIPLQNLCERWEECRLKHCDRIWYCRTNEALAYRERVSKRNQYKTHRISADMLSKTY